MIQWISGPWDTVCIWEQVCTLDSKWEHLFKDYIPSGETSSSSLLSAPVSVPEQSDWKVPLQVNWLAQKEKILYIRYIWVGMYMCIWMCVYVYVCICVDTYVYSSAYTHTCVCVCVCICMFVCVYIQIYVCVYVSACLCVYVCIYSPKEMTRFLPNHP